MSSNSVINIMKHQLETLDDINEMIEKCKKENLCDEQDETEIILLRNHCREMFIAADIAMKFAERLKAVEDERRKADEAKRAQEKKEEEMARKNIKKSPPVKKPEIDDEDLDFLS